MQCEESYRMLSTASLTRAMAHCICSLMACQVYTGLLQHLELLEVTGVALPLGRHVSNARCEGGILLRAQVHSLHQEQRHSASLSKAGVAPRAMMGIQARAKTVSIMAWTSSSSSMFQRNLQ